MQDRYAPRAGDIVFIAVRNYLYRRVAAATGSPASHVGMVFDDPQLGWVVAESTVPLSRCCTLDRFLQRSAGGWFTVRRVLSEPTPQDVAKLRAACDARMGLWYHLGFRYDSPRTFCSKFVYEVCSEALGMEIGTVETFSELLRQNQHEALGFWRLWFLGRIPWARRTVTPASQMRSPLLRTVWQQA